MGYKQFKNPITNKKYTVFESYDKDVKYYKKKTKITVVKKEVQKKDRKSYSRTQARKLKIETHYCEACDSQDCLEVHHIDGDPLNNDITNLRKLCLICHYEVHKKENVGKLMYIKLKNRYNIIDL